MTVFLNIALRRLRKEKAYALVCILSLSLGLAGAILISLYLLSELTFDNYHVNHARIFRVSTELSGTEVGGAGLEIGPLLDQANPAIQDYTRLRDAFENRFRHGDNEFEFEDAYLADDSVFDLFTLIPVRGDPETALLDRYSIALSESMAERFFGERDPIGQTLSTERFEFRVTLVFEDLPENVSQRIDALLPLDLIEAYRPDYLEDFGERFISNYSTYLLVSDSYDPQSIVADSRTLFENNIASGFGAVTGNVTDLSLTHHVTNLSDLHFSPPLIGEDSSGNIVNLYLFAAVMLALLVSSCFNYVNLTTARISTRLREVAMRKLLGASARNLISQFIGESVLIVLLAYLVGILLAIVAIEAGAVSLLTGKVELGELLLSPGRFALFVAVGFLIGVLTGIYPACKLAAPSIMAIMQSPRSGWRRRVSLRQILVWLQTAAAITITACVLIMLRQTDFVASTPMGFKKQDQLVVNLQGAEEILARGALMTELRQHVEINDVVEMNGALGRSLSISILPVEKNTGETENLTTNSFSAGETFLDTLEIELVEGAMFENAQTNAENRPVLVNETMVRRMEWEQPIGKSVGRGRVVGVIRDIHYLPLHLPIAPMFISLYNDGFLEGLDASRRDDASIDLIVNFTGNDEAGVRAHIIEVVDRFSDQAVIDVRSMSELWSRSYDDDARTVGLVAVFALLSIVISLLGLGGMTAYDNLRRSREVAIRRVLGASSSRIILQLSRGMIWLIGLAVLPAFIGAFLLSSAWLERFAYVADISAFPYVLSLVIVAACSALVLCLQGLLTVSANPVVSLRQE